MGRLTRHIVDHDRIIAAIFAVGIALLGLQWGSHVGGGADSYGYVSQADLWLRGSLHINQDFVADAPWPLARFTFAPLGYQPEPDGYRIVPVYPSGLPLMMAAAKAVAGQCGLFWVVPICGGILVWATHAIGRRLGRPIVGLVASWIVATSPVVIYMVMTPMSDLPAAAAWAVAVAAILGDGRASASGAGLAAALAILVRPNLAPMAGALALWTIVQDVTAQRWTHWRRLRAPWFISFASIGMIAVALLNDRLYGSPLRSGYGDLNQLFAAAYALPNLQTYGGWLLFAETPLAFVGLAALMLPLASLWPTGPSRSARWLLAACGGIVWTSYLFYQPFDGWWYLRFLLPSWPMMAIGAASALGFVAHLRPTSSWTRWAAAAGAAMIGVHGLVLAIERSAFTQAQGEMKYIEVANVVSAITAPEDVIFSLQHSGTLRYYAGRMTIRWNRMDDEWFDRAVAWCYAHGHHPYLLLEGWEAQHLTEKYGTHNSVARLDWTPIASFRNGAIRLYDAVNRDRSEPPLPLKPLRASHTCQPPAQTIRFRLR